MKFLVIGLGSMGKRRVRNLQHLGEKDIIGFDLSDDRRQETNKKYGIEVFSNFEKAVSKDPDVFIISTPPDKHIEYALIAARSDRHFFTEADVMDDGMEELIEICKNKNIVAAPSVTPIFRQSTKIIKQLLDKKTIGKVLLFTHHLGQYLPDWHPWEDISTFYVGKRETGACREMVPFEMIWLNWLFGDVDTISCFKSKQSNLHVDIDDTYQIMMRFKNGIVASLVSDVVSRHPFNSLRIIGETGVIEWEWLDKIIRVYDSTTQTWTEHKETEAKVKTGFLTPDDQYVEEMRHFINSINGKEKYFHTFEDNYRILQILYAAEESSDTGMHIKME